MFLIITMAGSIKLFQFFQMFHQVIGICEPYEQYPTKSLKTIFLFCLAQYILTTALFLAFEATSIFEYGFAFYILFTIINFTIIYSIFISQPESTFQFIQNCEKFIQKSKYQSTKLQTSKSVWQYLVKEFELIPSSNFWIVFVSLFSMISTNVNKSVFYLSVFIGMKTAIYIYIYAIRYEFQYHDHHLLLISVYVLCIFFAGLYSTDAYKQLTEKIELCNKLFSVAIFTSITILYFMPLPYSIVRYHIFDLGTDSFYLFSMCWFVFRFHGVHRNR